MAPCDVKLLIVDDHPMVRRALVRTLSTSGFTQICEAEDIASALQTLKRTPLDVVLTDWTMPVLGGFDLLRLIRGNPTLAHLFVVIVTGYATSDQVLAARQFGVAGIVGKPWQRDELVRTIMLAVNGG